MVHPMGREMEQKSVVRSVLLLENLKGFPIRRLDSSWGWRSVGDCLGLNLVLY